MDQQPSALAAAVILNDWRFHIFQVYGVQQQGNSKGCGEDVRSQYTATYPNCYHGRNTPRIAIRTLSSIRRPASTLALAADYRYNDELRISRS